MGRHSGGSSPATYFCLLSQCASTFKGKNLLPLKAHTFLLEQTSFGGISFPWEVNRQSPKLSPFEKMVENMEMYQYISEQ